MVVYFDWMFNGFLNKKENNRILKLCFYMFSLVYVNSCNNNDKIYYM